MVSETKNKLNKLFISTFIEWIARLSIERFRFIFWQYERPTNWHQFLARRLYDHDHDGPCIRFGNFQRHDVTDQNSQKVRQWQLSRDLSNIKEMACNLRKSDTIKLHKCHLISWSTVIRYMFKTWANEIRLFKMGARHLSGFLTCKVLHLSGNFMLKRVEFTYFTFVLPVFLITFLKTDFHQKLINKWKNIYLKFHTALRIHNKITFQLKHLD